MSACGAASLIFWLVHYQFGSGWFADSQVNRFRASFGVSAALAAALLGGRRAILISLFTGVLIGEQAFRLTHPLPKRNGFYIQLPGLSEEQLMTNKLEDLVEQVGIDHQPMITRKDFKQL